MNIKIENKSFKKLLLLLVAISLIGTSAVLPNYNENTFAATESGIETTVKIANGAKLYFGGNATTYVGENNVFSDEMTVSVKNSEIDANIKKQFEKHSADTAVNLMALKNPTLPSVEDLTKWQGFIPKVVNDYWLSDVAVEEINDGHKQEVESDYEKRLIKLPIRAFANGDGTFSKQSVTLSGKHKGGAWFDSKSYVLGKDLSGGYKNTNADAIELANFTIKAGYYKDMFEKSSIPIRDDFYFGKTDLLPNKAFVYSGFHLKHNRENYADGILDPVMFPNIYSSVKTDASGNLVVDDNDIVLPSAEVSKMIEDNPIRGGYLYDPVSNVFIRPEIGRVYPAGTVVAIFFAGYKQQFIAQGASISPYLKDKYLKKTEKISGQIIKSDRYISDQEYKKHFITPAVSDFPIVKKNEVSILYIKLPRELKTYSADYSTMPSYSPFTTEITEGMRYYETDKPVTGKNLEGATSAIRPKMTLDTSKVKFARANTSSIIASNNKLGAMPETDLKSGSSYKLVLKNDKLKVNTIAKDAKKLVATGGANASAEITADNYISVTPGTTSITIPVSALNGNKISAIAKKKDATTAYGVVGDVNGDKKATVTIDLADLMDTSKLGSTSQISLFNEQQNAANKSDEISAEGLNITVKVENPQAIDFTQDTKDKVFTKTYAYGDTFEVEATVTKKGTGDVADTTTPITFTTDTNYLKQDGAAKKSDDGLTYTAKFRVEQPQSAPNMNELKIKINRAASATHDAAPEVSSISVLTEKRKIDLKINDTVFGQDHKDAKDEPDSDSDAGKERISLKIGDTVPDVAKEYKGYLTGKADEDAVVKKDMSDGNIPFTVTTKHWLGDSTQDAIPVDKGKILEAAKGNIWSLEFTKSADKAKTDWFDLRYEVVETTPKKSIVDVFDVTGSAAHGILLYANNIWLTLDEYKAQLDGVSSDLIHDRLITLGKAHVTNAGSPYLDKHDDMFVSPSPGSGEAVRMEESDSHAGDYKTLYRVKSGDSINTNLYIYDYVTKDTTRKEEAWANKLYLSIDEVRNLTDEQVLAWSQSIAKNTYTGKNVPKDDMEVVGKTRIKPAIGVYKPSIVTIGGTSVTIDAIVRDNASHIGDVRLTANNLRLTVEEATQLVTQLESKTKISDKLDILSPTDTASKFGMYPKAIKVSTGNRVEITGIEGLPTIPSGKTDVADGVYNVTFKTDDGESVNAKIIVYVADPTAYVQIPKKIVLKKSTTVGTVATSNKDTTIKVVDGKGDVLTGLSNKIIIDTPATFDIAGAKGSKPTSLVVTVFDKEGIKHDGTSPLVTFDKDGMSYTFSLAVLTDVYDKNDENKVVGKNESEGVTYNGTMQFKVRFESPLPNASKTGSGS